MDYVWLPEATLITIDPMCNTDKVGIYLVVFNFVFKLIFKKGKR